MKTKSTIVLSRRGNLLRTDYKGVVSIRRNNEGRAACKINGLGIYFSVTGNVTEICRRAMDLVDAFFAYYLEITKESDLHKEMEHLGFDKIYQEAPLGETDDYQRWELEHEEPEVFTFIGISRVYEN